MGLAAGKTTALRFFAEAGALTLSADEVVHQLYAATRRQRRPLRAALRGRRCSADGDGRPAARSGPAWRRPRRGFAGSRRSLIRWWRREFDRVAGGDAGRPCRRHRGAAVVRVGHAALCSTSWSPSKRRGSGARRARPRGSDSRSVRRSRRRAGSPPSNAWPASDLVFVNDGDLERLRARSCAEAYERARLDAPGVRTVSGARLAVPTSCRSCSRRRHAPPSRWGSGTWPLLLRWAHLRPAWSPSRLVGVLTHAGLPDAVTARLYPIELPRARSRPWPTVRRRSVPARRGGAHRERVRPRSDAPAREPWASCSSCPTTAKWVVGPGQLEGARRARPHATLRTAWSLGACYLFLSASTRSTNRAAALAAYNAGRYRRAEVGRQQRAGGAGAPSGSTTSPSPRPGGSSSGSSSCESVYRQSAAPRLPGTGSCQGRTWA